MPEELLAQLTKSKTFSTFDDIASDVLKSVLLLVKEFCSPIVQRYNATEFLNTNVASKLEAIPIENRKEPSVKIFKRVLEGALEVPDEPLLKEMFANLLVSDMNTETKSKVHPKFASILADMTAEEARFFKIFQSINSIPRLIIYLSESSANFQYPETEEGYLIKNLENHQEIIKHLQSLNLFSYISSIESKSFSFSVFGFEDFYYEMENRYSEKTKKRDGISLTTFGMNFRDLILPLNSFNV